MTDETNRASLIYRAALVKAAYELSVAAVRLAPSWEADELLEAADWLRSVEQRSRLKPGCAAETPQEGADGVAGCQAVGE